VTQLAASGIAGTPALPNVDGRGSVADASLQACEQQKYWRGVKL
jgi:hypothetical protein